MSCEDQYDKVNHLFADAYKRDCVDRIRTFFSKIELEGVKLDDASKSYLNSLIEFSRCDNDSAKNDAVISNDKMEVRDDSADVSSSSIHDGMEGVAETLITINVCLQLLNPKLRHKAYYGSCTVSVTEKQMFFIMLCQSFTTTHEGENMSARLLLHFLRHVADRFDLFDGDIENLRKTIKEGPASNIPCSCSRTALDIRTKTKYICSCVRELPDGEVCFQCIAKWRSSHDVYLCGNMKDNYLLCFEDDFSCPKILSQLSLYIAFCKESVLKSVSQNSPRVFHLISNQELLNKIEALQVSDIFGPGTK